MSLVLSTTILVILPLILLYWLYKSSSRYYPDFIFLSLLTFSYITFFFLAKGWAQFPFAFLRYPLFLTFFVAFYFSFRRVKRSWKLEKKHSKQILWYSIKGVKYLVFSFFIFVFTSASIQAIQGYITPPNSVDLQFPLVGKHYVILQGGSNQILNHHYRVPAQKYALDILKGNVLGQRAKNWNPKNLDDFFIYQAQVVSPCDGLVIKAIDGLDDVELKTSDRKNIAGNHIVILSEEKKVYVLLAHLKKGSLLVQEGDRVSTRQSLGLVGNSGNTSEPHLHIHCTTADSEDYLFKGKGVPITFNTKYLVRNQTISN